MNRGGTILHTARSPEMMTDEDKELLNAYHKRVYETLAPHMKEDERKWLAEYTRAI